MSEFLLEIFCEEIPARMQKKAIADFEKIFCDFFTENDIIYEAEEISSFISPNRMVFLAKNIPDIKITSEIERFGPKINANQSAIDGFLKSVGLKNVSDLDIRVKNNMEYYHTKIPKKKIEIFDLLQKKLPDLMKGMSLKWQKTMRWHGKDSNEDYWIRPIRNILAIFDQKLVKFEFANLASKNSIIILNKRVKIENFNSYKDKLLEKNIIFDHNQRKEIIYNNIEKICEDRHIDIIENPHNSHLMNEIIGLTTSPNIMVGKIDDEFLDLPPEILVLTIKSHQKYLCTEDKYRNLAPYFIFVSDIDCKNNDKIILDNEKVLRARLSDAEFFIKEDEKIEFADRTTLLKNIIFHEKLDSLFNKVSRISAMNKFMSIWVPHSDMSILEQISLLCKNDLTTKAVSEFPELQGMIGSYYCKKANIDHRICNAISEQYMPVGASDALPMTNHGQLLAISDKLDTISGLFLINQKPSSSKDPMGVRRMAIGIINIILHNDLHIPLKIIIDKSLSLFPNSIILNNNPEINSKNILSFKKKLSLEIISFFLDRLKFILKDDKSINPKIVNEVARSYEFQLKNNKQRKYNLIDFVNRVRFINDFVKNSENESIINSYKRVANIVNIEENKSGESLNTQMKGRIFLRTRYERILDNQTRRIYKKIEKLSKTHKYQECYHLLRILEKPLENFFDHVTINVDNKSTRIKRLTLLARIKYLFENIFDFSKI